VDRLLAVGEMVEAWWKFGMERVECLWSARLSKIGSVYVPGFGASDCRCPGHLVRFEDRNGVSSAYQLLGVDLHRHEMVQARPLAPPR